MPFGLWESAHERNIRLKQTERNQRIADLPEYLKPLTRKEVTISRWSVEDAVSKVRSGELKPLEILKAYGKRAISCQKEHNSLTEIMIKGPNGAEEWATHCNLNGPLAGFPVSLKDTVAVEGYDSTVGYSKFCFKPLARDAPLVRLLRDAGAYPHVKTNIPFSLLSFESYNDIWGTAENSSVHGFTPGGSTGGEGALLAYGGSRIGIGTDVAGSVRCPAHFSGIYSLRCTTTRFPKVGSPTSMPGQEGIPSVTSPMSRTLPDLQYFFKSIIDMKPWKYDYTVTELPWREPSKDATKKAKFGVVWSDGIVDPSPACLRALETTVHALKAAGHEVVEFTVPDPLEALTVGGQLLCSDGTEVIKQGMYWGENNEISVERAYWWAHLPNFVRRIAAWWVEHVRGDHIWAELLRNFTKKSINERWTLVSRREGYKMKFFDAFQASGVDFLVTPPSATPALPHRGFYWCFASCLYTFLFNIVDYPAGIIPVTRVDRHKDALPETFDIRQLNGVARGSYVNYNAEKMHGLPVGVQIVGSRFHEEDVLAAMVEAEAALNKIGVKYKQLNE